MCITQKRTRQVARLCAEYDLLLGLVRSHIGARVSESTNPDDVDKMEFESKERLLMFGRLPPDMGTKITHHLFQCVTIALESWTDRPGAMAFDAHLIKTQGGGSSSSSALSHSVDDGPRPAMPLNPQSVHAHSHPTGTTTSPREHTSSLNQS